MKKKSLIILLVVSIGLFVPKEVYAQVYNEYNSLIEINYEIKDNEGRTNLNYKLYDKSGAFNLQSTYDANNDVYVLRQKISENSRNSLFSSLVSDVVANLDNLEIKDSFFEKEEYEKIFNNNKSMSFSKCDRSNNTQNGSEYDCSSYGVIPLILEQYQANNLNSKKIVFATIHNSLYWEEFTNNYDYTGYEDMTYREFFLFSLINNDSTNHEYIYTENCYYDSTCIKHFNSNHNPDNIGFMKNKSYDYSDELWEELNNMKISSSEIDEQVAEILSRTNDNKVIYSKYKSNINYRFKVKNGNGMNFKLHDISNTFNFSSLYDKDSDTYSIVDNSNDNDYQEGIKEFSKIIIDEVKNGKFNELSTKYKSITSDNCSSDSCNIYTYIPMILEGESNDSYAKQIVLGLVNVQYREENGNDYYDIGLNVYNNTCDLLSSNIDADMSQLINLSRSFQKDYSNNLINQYSDGSISINDIYEEVDVNTLKEKYCNDVPVISLRRNPKTINNGVIVLIISMMIVIGSSVFIIKKRSVKI